MIDAEWIDEASMIGVVVDWLSRFEWVYGYDFAASDQICTHFIQFKL